MVATAAIGLSTGTFKENKSRYLARPCRWHSRKDGNSTDAL